MNESDAAAANAAASAAAKLKARSGGRRRSCNRCSAKKERCDGQEPCHRCARSGLECLYASCRTLGRPRNASPPVKRRSKAAAGVGGSAGATAAVGSARARHVGRGAAPAKKGRSGSSATQAAASRVTQAHSHAAGEVAVRSRKSAFGYGHEGSAGAAAGARGAPAGVGAVTAPSAAASALKRLSLSPSPATGLTGLVQNRYLTCFVDDFSGFFQVLDEVTIRLGLINLMSGKVDPTDLVEASEDPHPVPKRRRNGDGGALPPPAPHYHAAASPRTPSPAAGGQHGQQVSSATVEAAAEAAAAAEEEQEVVNAINSSVFSAMSLGAMLLGQPPSHVHIYVAVAEASLRLCGVTEHLTMAVPNEHVAAAALLLAFAANISGREEYGLHIHLARQCYDRRVRHGLPTPPPIRDSLGYRAVIDALGKPPDARGLRIPSPSRETRVPPPPPPPPPQPSFRGQEHGGDTSASSSSYSGSNSDSGGGSCMVSPGAGGGLDGQPPPRGVGGSGAAGAEAAAPGPAGGVTASGEGPQGGRDADEMAEEPASTHPPGLEAARERRRLRRADPMSMVSDIMAMLSRVPWTANVEEAARRTKRELGELRSLMIAEKALAEERRFASGRTKRRSDGIAVFALASASIGLHCALDEFSELLRLGREVASCIHCCPGLARYQPHAYHAGLVILAAFGKRQEFEALLRAAPTELRFSASSGRPLTYEAHSDTCSHPVCRKHAKAIAEMGKQLRNEDAGSRSTASRSSVTVEEVSDSERDKNGGAAGGQAESRSMSGKVSIRRAADVAAGASGPAPQSAGAAQEDKFAALVLRLPSPPDSPGHPLSFDDNPPPQGPPSPAQSATARGPESAVEHAAAVAAGSTGVNPREAEGGEASARAGETQTWSPDYRSSWSTPPPVSQDSPTSGKDATGFSLSSGVASFGEGGEVLGSSQPLHAAPTLAQLNDLGLGVLSAAATAMSATPARPAGSGTAQTQCARGKSGGSGSGGGSSSSGLPVSQAPKRSRVAVSAASNLAASSRSGGASSGARGPGARPAHSGTGIALEATARKSGGSSGVVSSRPTGGVGAYGSYPPQQQGSKSAPPPATAVSAPLDDRAKIAAMMRMPQQPAPAPVARSAAVNNSSGVQAIHAAAPAGGTLTWRLWGAPRSSLAAPNNGLPGGGGGGGSGPGLISPSLHNHPPVAAPGVPRPWQWHGHVPSATGFAPVGPYALSGGVLGGQPLFPSAAAGAALFPVSAQQGLSPSGVVRVIGTGVAASSAGTGQASTPSPSFPTPGRPTAGTTAPLTSSRPPSMTAGEASAAAISLAALAGAGSANQASNATGSRKAPRVAAAAAPVPAASAPATGVQGVSGSTGGEEAGCVEPHEEEMMALWEIIGTGDSE